MSWWIVNYIPSWLLLIGLIVLIAGGAALIQRYVRRRFPVLKDDAHSDVTKFTYGFIGFVYAFFVGFVVSSMWGQNNTADGNARAEGATGVQMARDAVVFETADQDRIRHSLLAYEQAAIVEWPQAGNNRSPDADTALSRLYTAYDGVAAKTDTQKTLLATTYSNLDKISQARTVRLLTAREDAGLPWPFWAVIFLTSSLVLGTVIIYGSKNPSCTTRWWPSSASSSPLTSYSSLNWHTPMSARYQQARTHCKKWSRCYPNPLHRRLRVARLAAPPETHMTIDEGRTYISSLVTEWLERLCEHRTNR